MPVEVTTLQILLDTERARRDARALDAGIRGLGTAARTAQAAILVLAGSAGIGLLGKSMFDAGMKMQSAQKAMESIAGSTDIAANELRFLRTESDRLGQSFPALIKSYTQLAAAAKGTVFQGQQTREIFSAMGEAALVLGLGVHETEGAFRAFQQMMSKGTVNAEELRLQLGDRLPGAFQIFSRALGVSTAELQKMLERGTVFAAETLPKVAQELHRTYGGAVAASNDSARAALARFSNAWFDLKVAVAESGLLEGVTQVARGMTELINQFRTATADIGDNQLAMDAWRFAASLVVEIMREMVITASQVVAGFQIMSRTAQNIMPSVTSHLGFAGRMIKAFLRPHNTQEAMAEFFAQEAVRKIVTPQPLSFSDALSKSRAEALAIVGKQMGFEDAMNRPPQSPSPQAGRVPRGGLIPDGPLGAKPPPTAEQDSALDRLRKLAGQMRADTLQGTAQMRAQAENFYVEQIDQLSELGAKAGLTTEQMGEYFRLAADQYKATLGRIPDDFVTGWKNAVDQFGTLGERAASVGEGIAQSLDQNMTDAIMSLIDGTKDIEDAFSNMARAIAVEVTRTLIQQFIVRQLISSIGGVLGSFGGGTSVGSAAGAPPGHYGHSGWAWPRMHNGGVLGDEMPIIAKRGEVYFTPEQMSALGKAIAGNQQRDRGKIEIANYFDESEIDHRLAANPDLIVNAIGRRRSAVKRLLS